MQLSRFRFTIGQLIKLIAYLAMVFALLRTSALPLIAAHLPVVLGFAIDRARGGAGILGSMLAGVIEALGLGLIALVLSRFSYLPGLASSDVLTLLVGAAFLGILGLAWGVCIGTWLWMFGFLAGLGTGAEPLPAEPIGPIVWRGFGDRSPEHPRARGHQV